MLHSERSPSSDIFETQKQLQRALDECNAQIERAFQDKNEGELVRLVDDKNKISAQLLNIGLRLESAKDH